MKLHNIRDYQQLQNFWRAEIKSMIDPSTKVIFWDSNLAIGPKDIVQLSCQHSAASERAQQLGSKIILSNYDSLNLAAGLGDSIGLPGQMPYVPWSLIAAMKITLDKVPL